MPDRQRHGRLSEGSDRLFPARSGEPEDAAEKREAASADEPWPADRSREAAFGDAQSGDEAPRRRDSGASWFGDEAPPVGEPLRLDGHPRGATFGGAWSGDEPPPEGEPIWPGDPRAETMQLSRAAILRGPDETVEPNAAAWELAAQQGREAEPEAESPDPMADTTLLSRIPQPDHPDPTAETMLLSRVTPALSDPETADPDTAADTTADVAETADTEPPTPWSPRAFLLQHRRRFAAGLAGAVVVAVLLALSPVRSELRDSFTRTAEPYTALYFTTPPQVDGTVLTVPVSVHAVDTGTDQYSVRVWTVDSKGRVDDSRNVALKWDGQALSAVVNMPVNPAAEFVWVSLDGSGQTLHYKIAVA